MTERTGGQRPDGDGVRIRRIRADEGPLLRSLRLRALAEEPEAFGESVAEASARDDAEYVTRARAASDGDRRAWFIAEPSDGEAPVGLAMGRRRPPHDCMLFSLWVAGPSRGRGVGRRLVEAVEAWARGWGASSVVLWVFRVNAGAIDFYERLGFVIEVSGPDAVLGAPHDAVAMHRRL